ncbi:MAG: hypothetical protein IJM30_06620 [Thermoguttaceae bacterium]|nr:hypothetical protein [Thermoguttaceae bacterium]
MRPNVRLILAATVALVAQSLITSAAFGDGQNVGKVVKARENNKMLVVYFSKAGENYNVGDVKTGNTKILAEKIAKQVGADLFEIAPKIPYPKKYDDCTDFAKEELRKKARPEYLGEIENWEQYEVVFFGYPIWWGDLPMPCYTFIEKRDWNGKKVIPFITHEGSGASGTPKKLEKSCRGAKILKEFVMTGTQAQKGGAQNDAKLSDWLKGLKY